MQHAAILIAHLHLHQYLSKQPSIIWRRRSHQPLNDSTLGIGLLFALVQLQGTEAVQHYIAVKRVCLLLLPDEHIGFLISKIVSTGRLSYQRSEKTLVLMRTCCNSRVFKMFESMPCQRNAGSHDVDAFDTTVLLPEPLVHSRRCLVEGAVNSFLEIMQVPNLLWATYR